MSKPKSSHVVLCKPKKLSKRANLSWKGAGVPSGELLANKTDDYSLNRELLEIELAAFERTGRLAELLEKIDHPQ